MQIHAIDSRTKAATELLQQQSQKIDVSDIAPDPTQLFEFDIDVEKYAKKVRKQRRNDTTLTPHPRQQPARADSFQPTNSTASGSFASNLYPSSEPITPSSPATSTTEHYIIRRRCRKCTKVPCVCAATESDPVIPTRPPSPKRAPPPRPPTFKHPSHRFDRNWEQTKPNYTNHQSTKCTCPAPHRGPCQPSPFSHELAQPHPNMDTLVDEYFRSASGTEASDVEPDPSDDEEDDPEHVGEASDAEAQPSPFRPIAGVQGKFPRNWRTRHERSGSLDDHWHRKL
jgi:hypothetical protein